MDLHGWEAIYVREGELDAKMKEIEADGDADSRKANIKRLDERITRSDEATRSLLEQRAQLQQQLTACEEQLRKEDTERETCQSKRDQLIQRQDTYDEVKREHGNIINAIVVSKDLSHFQ
jgi:chromosome segregation ATPase